jgi:MFS family permease
LAEPEAIRLLSLITLGGIALQLPLGWLADHTPRVGVVLGLAIAFMILSMALPAALAHPLAAGSLAFVLGGVILGFYSVGLGLIGEEVAAEELASVNAAFIVLYQAGSIAGPIASGAAMSQAPVEGFVVSVVALMLISCAAIVWLRRRHRQPQV